MYDIDMKKTIAEECNNQKNRLRRLSHLSCSSFEYIDIFKSLPKQKIPMHVLSK